jgi:hypothetical protein
MKPFVTVPFALVVLFSGSTYAATRTLTFAPEDIARISADYVADDQQIGLPDGGASEVAVTFRLPSNYKKNSTIVVRAQLSSVDLACDVVVKPLNVKRSRIGRVGSLLPATDGGASAAVSSIVPMPDLSGRHFTQKFKLKPANVGPLLTQVAGDVISLTFGRDGLSGDDGCPSDLFLHFVDVTYTAN